MHVRSRRGASVRQPFKRRPETLFATSGIFVEKFYLASHHIEIQACLTSTRYMRWLESLQVLTHATGVFGNGFTAIDFVERERAVVLLVPQVLQYLVTRMSTR